MLASSPIPKQTVGRTFLVAIIILGVVSLIQLGAVGWAFVKRYRDSSKETHIALRGLPQTAQDTGRLNINDNTFAPDETSTAPVPTAGMPGPTPVNQKTLTKPLSPTQGRQNELAEQARVLRERGDMSTALTRLREAQALSADNPFILSEMALTYEKMEMKDKSLDLWQRIYAMGESAGSYYTVAKAKLNTVDPTIDPSQKDTEGFQAGSILALTDITKEDFDDAPVSRLKLKIPVKAKPGSKIEVHDVVIQVFFYDQVDENASIVRTNANVTSTWVTSPVDWADSDIEILEVEYNGIPPAPKEKHPENRKYFGYIVRVYYKGALQDMRAEPVKLLKQYPPPLTLSSEDAE